MKNCVSYHFACSLHYIVFSFEADGSPVSVRKFKAIFETHQYSAAERNQEPGTQYITLHFDRVMTVLVRLVYIMCYSWARCAWTCCFSTLFLGRKEESSSPPRGIVKNLRGLFENPQGFETRNG